MLHKSTESLAACGKEIEKKRVILKSLQQAYFGYCGHDLHTLGC
jgi:hypothetical protein